MYWRETWIIRGADPDEPSQSDAAAGGPGWTARARAAFEQRDGALLVELTQRLPDRFIIIDTPPCMASSDAAALAPLVGQIVFVVEAHSTQQAEVEAALSMLSACPRSASC